MADKFTGDLDWSRVYALWRMRLEDFRVTPWPFFTEIVLCDNKHFTNRRPDVAWWENDEIDAEHLRAQAYLNERPGALGVMADDGHGKGCARTLQMLREFAGDAEQVAAILILASIRSRRGGRNRDAGNCWPPTFLFERLLLWCAEVSGASDGLREWHSSMTGVLPTLRSDYVFEIRSMRALIHFVAEEHAQVLLQYRPILAKYGPEPDPSIHRLLKNAEEADERRMQEARRAEADRRETLRAEHPRWGEWDSVSRAELERLVWTKPVSQLAAEFGVSGVGIANRCKKWAIARPPRGFWLRVKSGKIEHPNGKPS